MVATITTLAVKLGDIYPHNTSTNETAMQYTINTAEGCIKIVSEDGRRVINLPDKDYPALDRAISEVLFMVTCNEDSLDYIDESIRLAISNEL